ncbi:sensor histidine kinase [Hymenobacter cellulosivorans]|uniref:histidine kinase n=1 Tax=Hymenobacter cellulosivorans TaxID=2932249 RepID=A0ABY4FDX2_9BACT|nr:HAMP domain-containing sensor histidine kinase [Hymenobacter cellulosivorans]UOQ54877.1 HAMP domain-containing histidine kinase [Hymenobacter cellulosivorans]
MKLLTTTNRYYLLLATLVFAVGSVVLYFGISLALRIEVDEQLQNQQREIMRGSRLKAGLLDVVALSTEPQPAGLRDTMLLDPTENVLVPYRQLSFRVEGDGMPQWVTLRKSLLETEDMVGLVLTVMLTVLGLLLLSLGWLNRWLSRRIWRPFEHTLAALRRYDLQHQSELALPVHTPIDEFTELNQALLHMSQRLVADYQSLKDFTENAAHETRTPLAIMQAKLEQLLQAEELRPATAALVGDLYSATVRLARLHHALTLLSKIENRQFPQAVPLQLEQVVENRLRMLQDFIDDKELVVTKQVQGGPARQMHPALADSLVGNLLQNAIKHNHRGGTLHWTLTAEYLSVSNTGPAVAGEPTRFFERFRKLNPSSESPGLGLSIVQQICRYYGYSVRYTFSAPDSTHTLRVEFGH